MIPLRCGRLTYRLLFGFSGGKSKASEPESGGIWAVARRVGTARFMVCFGFELGDGWVKSGNSRRAFGKFANEVVQGWGKVSKSYGRL